MDGIGHVVALVHYICRTCHVGVRLLAQIEVWAEAEDKPIKEGM